MLFSPSHLSNLFLPLVGYGEITPTTLGGRTVASIAMVLGVLLFAMPVTVLGKNFQIDFARQQNEDYIDQDDRFESLNIGITRCLKTLNQKGEEFPLARNELRKLEHVREMLGK
jgi:hypothetical protein